MKVFVGVDGGGTHARAVAVDESMRELARSVGPAGIVDPRDPEASARVVLDVVREVLRSADVDGQAEALCCGLAGAGRGRQRHVVQESLERSGVARRVLVVGDAKAAMSDAFGDGPGVLLIAGTGSIAWARNAAGETYRVGGWGHLLGDEGSGYKIGLSALRSVVRASDGRNPPTTLTSPILDACGVTDIADLIAWTANATKADIASLAPIVISADDDTGREIVNHAVAQLVHHVDTAIRVSGVTHPTSALAGGLIQPGGPLHEVLASRLGRRPVLDRRIDAALGAARIAIRNDTGPGAKT